MDVEKQLQIAALIKWVNGEALSTADMGRIITTFERSPLGLDAPDPQTVAGLQIKLRSVIQRIFMPPQQGQ